ncbi:site-specific integrase [Halopelagius longus]|uniref:Site-specific integrase n=1 Tax=Halopelagius longus TaxID=1236180 RepID=A0A1H0YT65_9EURY|nr:site-specific integrase [Halopelagius longus]SDQ18427.1 Site-specific recombinase XerD [Halopelagius longus]
MSNGLTPKAPAEAVKEYLNARESKLSETTIESQRNRLEAFVEWAEENGLQNMSSLSGRDIHYFRMWIEERVEPVILAGHLQTLREFLEFCAWRSVVPNGISERVHIPTVEPEEETRNHFLGPDRGKAVLDYLHQFQYASRDHALFTLLWRTGIRLGTLRSFDVGDFDAGAQLLRIRHRPKTETPLKNGSDAERSISISSSTSNVILDYINHHRCDVIDRYDRNPLITTQQGRVSRGAVRDAVYRVTRPCVIGSCPHDQDPKTCEAMDSGSPQKCPSSRSPHSIRRGSMAWFLRRGTSSELVSDQMDVSRGILESYWGTGGEWV